jgi:hypothetical protein
MLSIVNDKMRLETFEHPLVYHVSIWQLHRDGKFHRVGYAEDEFTHRAINDAMGDGFLRDAFWRGLDKTLAAKIEDEIDSM